jgi:hypothetical protein
MTQVRMNAVLTFVLEVIIYSFLIIGITFIVYLGVQYDIDISSYGFSLLMFINIAETSSITMKNYLYLHVNIHSF